MDALVGVALALLRRRFGLLDQPLPRKNPRATAARHPGGHAAGTAYPRARCLPGPSRTGSRRLLKEHADLHLRMRHPVDGSAALERSLQIPDQGKDSAETSAVDCPLPTISLYLESMNEGADRPLARLSAEVAFRLPL